MKKNLILIVAFLFAAKLATAQTEKGTQNLGVSLSLTHNNLTGTEPYYPDSTLQSDLSKFTYFSVGLNYSYFISDKLDIGADLGYGHNYNDNLQAGNGQSQTSNSYGGDIFIRKYLMCSSKFGFRAGPYVGYNRGNDSYTYTYYSPRELTKATENTINAGLRLDMVYYPMKHLGLAAELLNVGYSHGTDDEGSYGKATSNSVGANLITNGLTASVFYIF